MKQNNTCLFLVRGFVRRFEAYLSQNENHFLSFNQNYFIVRILLQMFCVIFPQNCTLFLSLKIVLSNQIQHQWYLKWKWNYYWYFWHCRCMFIVDWSMKGLIAVFNYVNSLLCLLFSTLNEDRWLSSLYVIGRKRAFYMCICLETDFVI